MFTGITQGLFPVSTVVKQKGLLHYTVIFNQALIENLKLGASVAIDGVCQTVVSINGIEVGFDAMSETLAKTTLNELRVNQKVSIERSLCFGDEIGGHEVSGHVFERGKLIAKKSMQNQLCLTIQCSDNCFTFIKPKGFIAVDGSSLTVGAVDAIQNSFEVYLIPETLRMTNFANKALGDQFNLEPDMKTMILVATVQAYYADLQTKFEKLDNKLTLILQKLKLIDKE